LAVAPCAAAVVWCRSNAVAATPWISRKARSAERELA
jgi:hypothetical protein